ncbi:GNAT family N-acetyltransferase [Micromonospora acroterricola]|uniref:GNAT family N-acetyltransferase n=1 Tax=Micromonospora acroterricola TaxID=2202421 RepID=A0A317CSP2_9ACTN|nr:GNAT family N-acetyltransferase [Micromonospora acroterricola]PWR05658.1 GNAT family N-acetyltransferase [Micromonospora acroterricola]
MTLLGTDRLSLRRLRDDDLDALASMNADPEVMRYILDGSVRDREQSAAGLRRMIRDWDVRGFGLFAVELRETGAVAGWVGLSVPEFLPEVLPAVEIGWRLDRGFWGHGYAAEAAAEVMRFGFETRDLDRIISIRHVDNARSARVMEKMGLSYVFRTVVPEHMQPVAVHALTREQYQARHRG